MLNSTILKTICRAVTTFFYVRAIFPDLNDCPNPPIFLPIAHWNFGSLAGLHDFFQIADRYKNYGVLHGTAITISILLQRISYTIIPYGRLLQAGDRRKNE